MGEVTKTHDVSDVCNNCGYPERMHPVSPELQCPAFVSSNQFSAHNNVDDGNLHGRRK